MNRKRNYLPIFFVGALCAIIIGWFWIERTPSESAQADHHHEHEEADHADETIVRMSSEQAKKYGIQVKTADAGKIMTALSTRGKVVLHPDKLAHILPKISGVSYEARKNLGDRVEQGEVLAVLESREMADIKAAYFAALEKEKLSTLIFERETQLNQKKVTAEQDFINAKSALEEAKINLRLAQQKLHTFGLDEHDINNLSINDQKDLRLYEIRSPIAGTVINRHITKGEFVENSVTIFEIADLNTVWVEVGIYPKDILKVKEGEIVTISLPEANMSAQAKLIYLSPIIQEETITAKAIAELSNPKGIWKPGTYVRVDMSSESKQCHVMVPRDAIQSIDSNDYVFIKTAEGFEKRLVQTGQCDNDSIEIKSGLNPGEEYAATETFLLKADLGKSTAEHED